jgi:hypothetical protein
VFVYFEKTQTPEILFFGLFAQSLAFETIRILVPLRDLYPFPGMLLIFGTRVLIFGRLFGIVSLFASSVYAAGLDFQKQGRVILAMVIAILVVSLKVPVNGLAWDTSYTMIFAYSSMFRFAENILLGITVASFLVAAHVRGTGDYLFIALGALLVSAGRSMLISADTWVTPLPALLVLGAGTWLVMVRLHRVYLWL